MKKNKEATVVGKLVAVNFYHEQWVGLSLPISHVRVKAVWQGIKRAHTRGARESTTGEKTINVGDADRDGRWQLRVGSGGESDVHRTGANVPAAAEGVGVRGGEWSVSQSIQPAFSREGLRRGRGRDIERARVRVGGRDSREREGEKGEWERESEKWREGGREQEESNAERPTPYYTACR